MIKHLFALFGGFIKKVDNSSDAEPEPPGAALFGRSRNNYTFSSQACVRGSTAWFKVARGIRQGCVLGPMLFNLLLDFCIRIADLVTV